MGKALGWLEKYGVGTNLFIAICGGIASTLPFLTFEQPVPFWFPFFISSGVWLTYTWQKAEPFHRILKDFSFFTKVLFLLVVFLEIYLSAFLKMASLVALVFAAGLAFAYVIPMFNYRGSKKSLRAIPYAKIWVVLLVWIIVVVVLPLLEMNRVIGLDANIAVVSFVIGQCFFLLGLIIPFDIRDLRKDSLDQATLPMILGVESSRRLSQICMVVAAFSVLIVYAMGYLAPLAAVFQIVSLITVFLLVRKTAVDRPDRFFTIWVDGGLMVQPLVLLIF